jgi:rhodanese-related sulfurtransferase
MKTLSTQELKQMLDTSDLVLVNTLSESDFETTRIPESINIPVKDADFISEVERTIGSKDTPVAVYCASAACDSSEKAADALEHAGFSHVYRYPGGAKAWRESGDILSPPIR